MATARQVTQVGGIMYIVRARPSIGYAAASAVLALLFTATLLRGEDPPSGSPRDLTQLQRCDVAAIRGMQRIDLRAAGRETPVRLAYLSSAADDDVADAASAYLARLLEDEAVYVELLKPREPGTPKDEVSDALLFRVPDGLFINVELVRLGYARARSGIEGDDGKLLRFYEQRARQAKKGIWAAAAKLAEDRKPAERKKDDSGSASGEDTNIVYVTAHGKKYHRKDCQYLTDTAKAISLAEARKTLEPCSRCKPPK